MTGVQTCALPISGDEPDSFEEITDLIRALCDELDQKNKQLSGLEEDCYELKAKLEAAEKVIEIVQNNIQFANISNLKYVRNALSKYKEARE